MKSTKLGPDWYGIFGTDADTDVKGGKIPISNISADILINILNVVIKYVWQRYVMKARYLMNFITNIIALNSKHFTYFQSNNGPLSAGQTSGLHLFTLLVQAIFQP